MRVLVFGDSITQGYWDVNGGWADHIRKYYDQLQLIDLDGKDQPSLFNLGVSADNSTDVLKRIKSETLARVRPTHHVKPAILIQIGINDCSKEPTLPQVSEELYASNLNKIIDEISPISSQIIFIGLSACDEAKTMPVSWGEHYSNNADIQKYEQIMQQVATARGISFIPVFTVFKKQIEETGELLADGLHPSAKGHEVITNAVLPKLQELLK